MIHQERPSDPPNRQPRRGKRRWAACASAALLCLTLLIAAGAAEGQDDETPDEVIVYKQVDGHDLRLDVFHPDGEPDGPRPAVVWFHGGGWITGMPRGHWNHAAHFAGRGMVAICVEYRVRKRHDSTPLDAVRDAFDAMRYVRAHADALGIDPDRIAAAGASAGGHLAAATATLTAEDLAGVPDEAALARPQALLLLNPVVDNGPQGRWGHDALRRHLGDAWADASPAHNLHAAVPPTLFLIGDSDKLIPVSTARRFAASLDRLGVTNKLIVYPGQEHSFYNADRGDGAMYRETLGEMDRFLVGLGWLPPL